MGACRPYISSSKGAGPWGRKWHRAMKGIKGYEHTLGWAALLLLFVRPFLSCHFPRTRLCRACALRYNEAEPALCRGFSIARRIVKAKVLRIRSASALPIKARSAPCAMQARCANGCISTDSAARVHLYTLVLPIKERKEIMPVPRL